MLSKKSEYAIIALVYLAKNNSDMPIPVREIAENENIPDKFLGEIMLHLRNAGIVKSKGGSKGGYSLQLKAEEISTAKIVRLFDGAIGLVACVAEKHYQRCEECKNEETCGLRSIFADIRTETIRLLEKATLKEIIYRSSTMDFNSQ